jgi:hypothetical protein
MTVSSEELQQIHNEGQEAGSEGQIFGEPWPGVFESHEDFQAREEAWKQGWENGVNNQPDSK